MTLSPIIAEYQRWPMSSATLASATPTVIRARVVTAPRSWFGMAWSMIRLKSSGGRMPSTALVMMMPTKVRILRR